MTALRELQDSLRAALLSRDNAALDVGIRSEGLEITRRLGIYRNTVFSNLRSALRAIFPVVERLVGADFFAFASDDYIRQYPSPAGDLNRYGEQFGDFIAGFAPAAALRYLPDVARLEWHVHQVYRAADHTALDIGRLAAIAPDRYETVRFKLHPASALFASPYPVHRIWQVNQPDYAGAPDIDLNSGGVKVLIERRTNQIVLRGLSGRESVFLQAFVNEMDFASACEAALGIDADYDIAGALQDLIAKTTLVDFVLP